MREVTHNDRWEIQLNFSLQSQIARRKQLELEVILFPEARVNRLLPQILLRMYQGTHLALEEI